MVVATSLANYFDIVYLDIIRGMISALPLILQIQVHKREYNIHTTKLQNYQNQTSTCSDVDPCSSGWLVFSLLLDVDVFGLSSTLDFSCSLLLTFPFIFSFVVLICFSFMLCSTLFSFLTVSSSVVALFTSLVFFEADCVGCGCSVLIFLFSCLIAGYLIFL